MSTCREAIEGVFADDPGVLTTDDVVSRIDDLYPDRPWKKSTISAHLIGLSANHSSSKHYPSLRQHAMLYSLGGGRYRKYHPDEDGTWVVSGSGVELVDGEEVMLPEYGDTSVSLEHDLEQWLLTDLGALEEGLGLYHDDLRGHQFHAGGAGRIDILATDQNGGLVVVELKAGKADDRTCGQILGYMGWVTEELAEDQPVRGIIVAHEFTERLRYAVKAMPNLQLKAYRVSFEFDDV